MFLDYFKISYYKTPCTIFFQILLIPEEKQTSAPTASLVRTFNCELNIEGF